MTAYTEMNNVGYVSFNRADNPPRNRKRADIAGQFVAAGFEMLDWNKFQLIVKNRTYKVMPGRDSNNNFVYKITGRTIQEGGLTFPNDTPPGKIALYLNNLADNPIEV